MSDLERIPASGEASIPTETPQPAVVAMSAVADFEPEDTPDGFIEWTFVLPRSVEVGAGLYEIRHLRCLTPEERADSYAALSKATAASAVGTSTERE